MEEDELDSEGEGDTVGAKTPAMGQNNQITGGRTTELTSKSKDVTINEENEEDQID